MNPFLAEIKIFAGNFAPRGWAFCEGQLLPISQYQALFSILGTTYGGDGRTSFGLPDLRGRAPIGPGQGPALSSYRQGQQGGLETVTLTTAEMPSHSHPVRAVDIVGNNADPTGRLLANTSGLDREYSDATANTSMSANMVASAGGNQSHENRQPFLAIYYIIAMEGVFPSRT